MDFAPYQSSPPEHSRVASPELSSPRPSNDAGRRAFSPSVAAAAAAARSPPPLQHPQPQRAWAGFDGQAGGWTGGAGAGAGAGPSSNMPGAFPAAEVSEFDTSLGLRLDYEACLAYLALPPLGAIVLLILERNSDYVRYGHTHTRHNSIRDTLALTSSVLLDFTPGSPPCSSRPSWSFTSSSPGPPSSAGSSSSVTLRSLRSSR